jgi:hypothetical protein
VIYRSLLPEKGMMRRRGFLEKGTVAVGIASSSKLLEPLTASEISPQKPTQISGPSAEYLRRVRRDGFLLLGVLAEELEHIRHAAPDDPAMIQSGQRLVLDLEVQALELIGQLLRTGNQRVFVAYDDQQRHIL